MTDDGEQRSDDRKQKAEEIEVGRWKVETLMSG
jgi:hypothetical protein